MAAVIMTVPPAAAQFLPNLQARTSEEFDAYLDVMESAIEPRIGQARRFLSAYPQSALRLPVHEMLAEACRGKGDAPCAIEAARNGLAIAPDYIPLLTMFATIDANTSAHPAEAKAAAERALRLLDQAKAPRRVEAGAWLAETARLRAENLATLGLAAFKSGDTGEAIRKLESAVKISPSAAHQYRLALLYIEVGRNGEARPLLEAISKSSDEGLRERAGAALKRLPAP